MSFLRSSNVFCFLMLSKCQTVVLTIAGDSNKLLEAVDGVEEEVGEADVEVVVFAGVEVEVVVSVGVEDLHEVAEEGVSGVEDDFEKKYNVLLISLF